MPPVWGCDWPQAFGVKISPDWPSGYYEVVLRAAEPASGRLTEHLACFAVRPGRRAINERADRMLLVLTTNTYNAYND